MRRVLTLAVVGASLTFGLAGCSSDDAESASAQWTNDVCVAFAELDTSLDELGEGLPPVDPTSGGSLSSAVDVVRAQVEQIGDSADNLNAALTTDLPPDAVEGLTELRGELRLSADDARAQIENVGTALARLIETPSVANLDELRQTVSNTQQDLQEIATSVEQTTSDASAELAATVRAAPACAPYLSPED
jgi:ABC-type transporter Mla subunit MlaD